MDDGTRTLVKKCEHSPLPITNKNCDRPGSQPGALPCRFAAPLRPQAGSEKSGVDDGTRTHDDRDHNPGLYQLSYAHH